MTGNGTAELLRLDSAGFLPAPGESREEFILRSEEIIRVHQEFDEYIEREGSADIFYFVTVRNSDRIAPELVDDVARHTWELYGFAVRHVPGFYLTKAVGLLWGGCMLSDPDENFSVLLLRNAFKKKSRFLSYTRDELLAHELCHSVRQNLCEITLEEYFAYQTSPSRLRRYLGNCFIRDWDAVLFVIPALLLFAASVVRDFVYPALWIMPFWILAFIYPLFLCFRNARSRRVVKRAGKKLEQFGISDVQAILFRCTREELLQLGDLADKAEFDRYAADLAQKELRWKIILERFITVEKETV